MDCLLCATYHFLSSAFLHSISMIHRWEATRWIQAACSSEIAVLSTPAVLAINSNLILSVDEPYQQCLSSLIERSCEKCPLRVSLDCSVGRIDRSSFWCTFTGKERLTVLLHHCQQDKTELTEPWVIVYKCKLWLFSNASWSKEDSKLWIFR